MKSLLMLALLALPAMALAETKLPDLADLKAKIDRFAPIDLKVDVSKLSAGDRKALVKLVAASRLLDGLMMEQLWSGNAALWAKVQADTSPLGKARARWYWMNKGPWSGLDEQAAFLPGAPPRKLEGANFYPEDMKKEELEAWVKKLSKAEAEQATGFFTVIRRQGKTLAAVPYSKEYAAPLAKIAGLLKEAAAASDNASLKRFLDARAAALLSNDYLESDVAWMDLDAPLEVTFGPYETYNDELFGYKAAFEAYVTLRDEAESQKLAAFARILQQVEDNLPLPKELKNPKVGGQAPIRVVNQVFAAGDAQHGVKSAAYNLPNDERVITQKGSKRVMLKNIQQAKFDKTLVPIASRVLAADERGDLSFESFFTHILAHELCHGLGPHQITVAGKKTTPREQLQDLYSAFEEAKADAVGLFAMQYFIDNAKKLGLEGVIATGPKAERQLYVTFLASTFRTLRFGVHEAHGKGMLMQVNFLHGQKAFVAKPDGTFAVDFAKVKDAVKALAGELLMLEAKGDRAGAQAFQAKWGKEMPELTRALAGLKDLPTDIEPVFVTADEVSPAG